MERKTRRRGAGLNGEVTQYEKPDWGPLENVIDLDACGHFMWMFEVEREDGTLLHAYKHYWNRRYLHLSSRGEAFAYIWTFDDPDYDPDAPSQYERILLHRALSAVLGPPRWPAVEARERHDDFVASDGGGF